MGQIEQSKLIAQYIYEAIQSKNVTDIHVLQVGHLTPLADIFIIATAKNTRLVAAMCDEIENQLQHKGYYFAGKEGYDTARWILLDYQGVIVHLFYKEEAEFYQLDRLWNDAYALEMQIK